GREREGSLERTASRRGILRRAAAYERAHRARQLILDGAASQPSSLAVAFVRRSRFSCRPVALFRLDHPTQPDAPLPPAHLAYLDALCVAPGHSDVAHPQTDQATAIRHQHHLVVVADLRDPHDPTGLLGDLHGDDALAAARLEAILVELAAFTLPALGDRQH